MAEDFERTVDLIVMRFWFRHWERALYRGDRQLAGFPVSFRPRLPNG